MGDVNVAEELDASKDLTEETNEFLEKLEELISQYDEVSMVYYVIEEIGLVGVTKKEDSGEFYIVGLKVDYNTIDSFGEIIDRLDAVSNVSDSYIDRVWSKLITKELKEKGVLK